MAEQNNSIIEEPESLIDLYVKVHDELNSGKISADTMNLILESFIDEYDILISLFRECIHNIYNADFSIKYLCKKDQFCDIGKISLLINNIKKLAFYPDFILEYNDYLYHGSIGNINIPKICKEEYYKIQSDLQYTKLLNPEVLFEDEDFTDVKNLLNIEYHFNLFKKWAGDKDKEFTDILNYDAWRLLYGNF